MRAWQIQRFGEPADAIELVDVPLPEPIAGEVRIRVEAAAIGLPDVFMCRGSYVFRPEMPFTPGQEIVGTVTAVGEGAETKLAARVMAVSSFFRGYGGLAEEALALDAACFTVPEEMAADEAACFSIPYHTAYLALVTRGKISAGESLVVLGAAGGSGSAAIQLGCALGARVIAVAGGDDKLSLCRNLGAEVVIDHRSEDVREAILSATAGLGANLIFDPVGGSACEVALGAIANEGRLLAIGFASGEWHDASTARLVGKNASLVGVYVGAYSKSQMSLVHDALLALWQQKKISSLVSKAVPFEEAGQALGELADRLALGKIIIRA